uniref:Uncharacterized protein n=1 Tax=Ananas comosus var. bracteatus TaxID=296719 RepID=A0A6V7Q1X6_ANACO|nr:unnamed protein product [Ananas comosus var. bracteatus]
MVEGEIVLLNEVIYPILSNPRDIKDPEHPYSLEQLNVVTDDAIEVNDEKSHVSGALQYGNYYWLCLRVKLIRSLPSRYKVDIRIAPGTHATEATVNKQLNDKERVAAALENPTLLEVIEDCLSPTFA